MKNSFWALTLVFMSAAATVPVQAQQTEVQTPRKEWRQRARIQEGRASGDLTRREARKLRQQQRHIHARKRLAMKDGVVTPREKHRIEQAQKRASRNIYRKKHNARAR
ncbi:MAG: hypothetical protein J5I41_04730 [Saprospiraceae bacterium]|nr:hypothetical protein [Saprospiraceae bacterium]